MHSSD
jgi:hypothetical protein